MATAIAIVLGQGTQHVAGIFENPDLKLQGISIADPSLSWGLVQQEIPALRFAQAHKDLFPFNASFYAQLQNISDTCGYTTYLDDFVTYPPKGQLPLPVGATFDNVTRAVGVQASCRMHSPIQREITMSVSSPIRGLSLIYILIGHSFAD